MEERQDLISRQGAIDVVKDVCDAIMSGCESWYDPETEDEVYKDILEVDAILKCNKEIRIALRNMPSADVQPVVRCKDCVYWSGKKTRYCNMLKGTFQENDYCSYAERCTDE